MPVPFVIQAPCKHGACNRTKPDPARARKHGLGPALAFGCMLLLLVARPALAHDLWLEREGAAFTLYQGHRHSAHAGAEVVPYPAEAVREVMCLDAAGRASRPALRLHVPLRIEAACAVLRLSFSTGYWSKTAWETVNRPKSEVAGAIDSWLAEETIQRIEAWTPAAARAWGDALSLTPLADPLVLKLGDKLALRVSRAGRPLAGVAVAYQGSTRGVTDAEGVIRIRLRQDGVQSIQASVVTPLNDGRADRRIETATLQFELSR